jgi:hypothetical protein
MRLRMTKSDINLNNNSDAHQKNTEWFSSERINAQNPVNPSSIDSQTDKDSLKNIKISFVLDENESECNFWVGLTKKGTLHPHNLLDLKNTLEIFDQAASQGTLDEGPIMLSDSRQGTAKYIYLLPPPKLAESKFKPIWIQDLIKTVKSWSPECVGLYLSPNLLRDQKYNEFLKSILNTMINETQSLEYCILIGSINLNSVINSILSLRAELLEQKVNLSVYH